MNELKRNGAKDYLFGWLLPAAKAGRQAEARHLSRLALLVAGLAVLEEGEKALGKPEHKDPFGDGPFEHRKTEAGFVLTSDWEIAPGQKLSLTFGK